MKNIAKVSVIIIFSSLVFIACNKEDDTTNAVPQDKTGQFLSDAEGWRIVGDAQGGYTEASYSPDGGVTNGYIYANDNVTGGTWYYAAPEAYHGDKSIYYGKTLKFSLFQRSAMSNQFMNNDIIFVSDTGTIVYLHDMNNYPDTTWTDYNINISEGYWLNDTYNSGDTATAAEIIAVLSDVKKFWIRGEFERGEDNGGLDNVIIE